MKTELEAVTSSSGQGEGHTAGLMRFDVGSQSYGVIAGTLGYIVAANDFRYQVRTLNENIELRANWNFEKPPQFQVLTLSEIRAIARPITSYREWAHHWGIKHRIKRNYEDMARHAVDLGADISTMPEWGEDVGVDGPQGN